MPELHLEGAIVYLGALLHVSGEGEPVVDEQAQRIDALAAELDKILSGNGGVLSERYRMLIPRALITRRQQIVTETGKILDAPGLPEEMDVGIMRHD